jgi:hypothetical protein
MVLIVVAFAAKPKSGRETGLVLMFLVTGTLSF